MHHHGPTCLAGPRSGSRPWWQTAADKPADSPGLAFRADLVARVRRAIADGTYDTPDKWEIALARLLDHLEG